jgi:ribosomal protein L32
MIMGNSFGSTYISVPTNNISSSRTSTRRTEFRTKLNLNKERDTSYYLRSTILTALKDNHKCNGHRQTNY